MAAQVGLVLLASGGPTGCVATPDVGCEGVTCRGDERCMADGEGEASCHPRCTTSTRCPDNAPICDDAQEACRLCRPGDDERCRQRSPQTPRCIGGQCVACIASRGVTSESPDCNGGSMPAGLRSHGGAVALSSAISATPVCDQGICRACVHHRECDSGVCAKDDSDSAQGIHKGQCVPFSQVLVVDQNLCSRSGPVFCTPGQAIERLAPDRRYVLLRKGALASDFAGLSLAGLPAKEGLAYHIIGPLADAPPQRADSLPPVQVGGVAGSDGIAVRGNAVVLEGLYVRGNRVGVSCSGASASLRVVRSLFAENETAILAENGCRLFVSESWLGRAPASSVFAGLSPNGRSIEVNAADFDIENSIFVDNGDYSRDGFGGLRLRAPSTSGRRSTVVNSTFHQQSGLVRLGKYYTTLWCDKPQSDRLVMLNTLFSTDRPLIAAPEEHYLDPSCGAGLFNLATNEATLAKFGVVYSGLDTIYLDRAGHDLRLRRGVMPEQKSLAAAGARQITVGDRTLYAPERDLDGQPRQGESVAVGAFEPATIGAR